MKKIAIASTVLALAIAGVFNANEVLAAQPCAKTGKNPGWPFDARKLKELPPAGNAKFPHKPGLPELPQFKALPHPFGDDVNKDILILEHFNPWDEGVLTLKGCLVERDGEPAVHTAMFSILLEMDTQDAAAQKWVRKHMGEEIKVMGDWYQYKTIRVYQLERLVYPDVGPIFF